MSQVQILSSRLPKRDSAVKFITALSFFVRRASHATPSSRHAIFLPTIRIDAHDAESRHAGKRNRRQPGDTPRGGGGEEPGRGRTSADEHEGAFLDIAGRGDALAAAGGDNVVVGARVGEFAVDVSVPAIGVVVPFVDLTPPAVEDDAVEGLDGEGADHKDVVLAVAIGGEYVGDFEKGFDDVDVGGVRGVTAFARFVFGDEEDFVVSGVG